MLDDALKSLKDAESANDDVALHDARIAIIKAQEAYDETSEGRARLTSQLKKALTQEYKEALAERKQKAFERYQEKNNQAVQIAGKKCRTCKERKSYEYFSRHKGKSDGLQEICNPCQAIRNKAYYKVTPEKNDARKNYRTSRLALIREVTVPLLKKGCTDCGNYYENAMDFDHISDGKTIDISSLSKQNFSVEQMLQRLDVELKICEVRCANCHRIATYERQEKNVRLMFLRDPDLVSVKHKHVFQILNQSSCFDCDKNDFRVLEFDHISSIKILEVSKMMQFKKFSIDDINAEIAKCRVRCVNCHRQKTFNPEHPEFRSQQEAKYVPTVEDLTCHCGKPKTFGRMECPACAKKPKIEWPPLEELLSLIKTTSFVRAGKYLGVSDNGIRKHLRNNGIDPKTFKKFTN